MYYRIKKYLIPAAVVIFVFVNYFVRFGTGVGKGELSVVFLNVGQGDCEFIHYKDMNFLIDGGTDTFYYRIERLLKKYNADHLDGYFFSHPHTDHVGSAVKVLENFGVNTVYLNDFSREFIRASEDLTELSAFLEKESVPVEIIGAGDSFRFGDLSFEVLSPVTDSKDPNEMSSVIRAVYGETSFLFTGDISSRSEKILAESDADIDSDVLKLAHHGSKSSTCSEFLDAVTPQICVVSSSKNNSYDHPSPVISDVMTFSDTEYYRTDTDGNVIIYSDGEKIFAGNGDYILY